MTHNPERGEPLTHQLQLQEVVVPQTPEDILARAREQGLISDEPPAPQKDPAPAAAQKPKENGDKKDDGETTSPPCKEKETMNYQATPQSAPQGAIPVSVTSLSDEDRAEMRKFAQIIANAVANQVQPQPHAPPTAPQVVYVPAPQGTKEPGYFARFDTVAVGEKLVTATGYGVIAIGTFAGCCGVAKLMGVVK